MTDKTQAGEPERWPEPARIWAGDFYNHTDHCEATGHCATVPLNSYQEYVRADLFAASQAEVERLTKFRDDLVIQAAERAEEHCRLYEEFKRLTAEVKAAGK